MLNLKPYLNFDGNCHEAMKFYHQVLGGELYVMTGAQGPGDCATSFGADRVMHARITQGENVVLMASDCPPGFSLKQGDNFVLNIECPTDADVDRLVTTLSAGGTVKMPAAETFFAKRFAMVTDRFGTNWMLLHHEKSNADVQQPAASARA